jgi:general secretion pathway protein H
MIRTPAIDAETTATAATGDAMIRKRTRGFTLLELMVVIVLIAAVTGLAVGVLGVGKRGRDLRGAARTLATELRFTRVQAMTTGTSQTLDIDLDTRRWTAVQGKHHGEIPGDLQLRFQGVRQEQRSQRSAAIRFFPDGSSTGGRISLLAGGAGIRVDVRWLTGEVTQAALTDSAP